jgi:hypothetical protein
MEGDGETGDVTFTVIIEVLVVAMMGPAIHVGGEKEAARGIKSSNSKVKPSLGTGTVIGIDFRGSMVVCIEDVAWAFFGNLCSFLHIHDHHGRRFRVSVRKSSPARSVGA